MTFSVVTKANDREMVVGTIWAAAEQEAQTIAAWLFQKPTEEHHVVVRRSEDREVPLRLLN